MAKPILPDELWTLLEPLLPPPKPRRFHHPGRKPVDNRRVLTGILFVLSSGIPWEALPQELGCYCGMTCWRKLHEWQEAGVWRKIHRVVLETLQGAEKIDWSRAVVDSSSVRAIGAGGKKRPQSDRSAKGRKQTPHRHRRKRNPFGRLGDRRQLP